MTRRVLAAAAATVVGMTAALGFTPAASARPSPADTVRFATFNASLNRAADGELVADLSTSDDPQANKVAEVIQRQRPDVLLINEFDYVPENAAVDLFRTNYLQVGHNGARPIDYPYVYTAPVNTGVPTGQDFNNDGKVGGPDDAFGFGFFPGQYGMAVFSRYPIDISSVRTFQKFLWKDMPRALLPTDPNTPGTPQWYSPEELEVFRLSSKSHWDLPVRIGRKTVHFLVSHPTPPSFDGAEKRNVKRNHDEIRLWADYVAGGKRASYLYDDAGRFGGLDRGASFVIAGDQNADPLDGDGVPGAADQLLNSPRVVDPRPWSLGGVEAANQGGANDNHRTPDWLDTADFSEPKPGNLRVDYVLPSRPLIPVRAGVFWPTSGDPLSRLNDASDHHAVWVDVLIPGR